MNRSDRYHFSSFQLDITTGSLYEDGACIPIPPKAALVLTLLLDRAGRYLKTDEILERLSPEADIGEENVTQYVAVLRKALRDDARCPKFIETRYGVGYRFVASVQRHVDGGLERTSMLLLEARYNLARRRPQNLKIALQEFLRVNRYEPGNVNALLGVAEASSTLGSHLLESPLTAFPRASLFARRALHQDPDVARTHSVLGHVALFWDQDAERAYAHCDRALRLDSCDLLAIRVLGRLAMVRKEWDEARRQLVRELELRPDSLDALTMLAVLELYRHRPVDAVRLMVQVRNLDATYAQSRYYLGSCLIEASCTTEAIENLLLLCRRDRSQHVVAALGRAYACAGKKNAARRILNGLLDRAQRDYVSPYLLATLHVALGERGDARARISEAMKCHDPWAIFFSVEPRFDEFRL